MDSKLICSLAQKITGDYIEKLDERIKKLYDDAIDICSTWDDTGDEEFKIARCIIDVFEDHAARYTLEGK